MTENTLGSVHRRTVVAGAAWTIPVVATAIGAPLAAASGDPTLAFTNGPYSVAACGTLKDVVLKATLDGTRPVPAETLVTVTLPSGLTWSNGETGSRPLRTDANGAVILSGIRSTRGNTTVQLSAAYASSTADAPVSVAARAGDGVHSYNHTTKVDTLRPNSTNAVAILGDTATDFLVWQDANGDIRSGNGVPLITGADKGTGLLAMNRDGSAAIIWYKKADGVHSYNHTTAVDTLRPNSTTAATILGDTATDFLIWQDANGDIRSGSGNPVVTGADTGTGLLAMNREGSAAIIWYKKADGVHSFNFTTKVDTLRPNSMNAVNILADTASGFVIWQDANGDIRSGSGNPVITGADTGTGLVAMNREGNDAIIWYKKADGVHSFNFTTKVDTLRPNSMNAVAILGDTATDFLVWQDANGDIRSGNGVPLITGADKGTGLLAMNRSGNDAIIWYKKAQPCA